MKAVAIITSVFASLISAALIASLFLLANRYTEVRESTLQYMNWKETAVQVQQASDYLTDQVRSYVVTGRESHREHYFYEAKVEKRRDKALEAIRDYLGGTPVVLSLESAFRESMDLMQDEYYAMRLIVESKHADVLAYPQEIIDVVLSDEDQAAPDEEKKTLAIDKVYGDEYNTHKDTISREVNAAIGKLDEMMESSVLNSTESLLKILIMQQILIVTNVIFLAALLVCLYLFVVRPVNGAVSGLLSHQPVQAHGIREYQFLANTYNMILEQSIHNRDKLVYQAEHDKMTGLYNRTGYDSIYRRIKLDKSAYILVDIDRFKQVNDKFGHEVGDAVLVEATKLLSEAFDSDDSYVFRIGGDEFSVIVEGVEEGFAEEVIEKFKSINEKLKTSAPKLPIVSLSAGIAFGELGDTTDSLFKKADIALYSMKRHGRAGTTVYGKELLEEQ